GAHEEEEDIGPASIPVDSWRGPHPTCRSRSPSPKPSPLRGGSLDTHPREVYICIVTQIHNHLMTPKQAAACCRPVDGLLDPEWFKALCDPTRVALLGCL